MDGDKYKDQQQKIVQHNFSMHSRRKSIERISSSILERPVSPSDLKDCDCAIIDVQKRCHARRAYFHRHMSEGGNSSGPPSISVFTNSSSTQAESVDNRQNEKKISLPSSSRKTDNGKGIYGGLCPEYRHSLSSCDLLRPNNQHQHYCKNQWTHSFAHGTHHQLVHRQYHRLSLESSNPGTSSGVIVNNDKKNIQPRNNSTKEHDVVQPISFIQ